MANDYYVLQTLVVDGDIAFAADVNNINEATNTAFTSVESDIDGLLASVEVFADLAQDWAEKIDGTVEGVTGDYSAKMWANTAEDTAFGGFYSALHHAAKSLASAAAAAGSVVVAEAWAENPEDDPVEASSYSALHWSAKSETFADNSSVSAAASAASAAEAEVIARALGGGNILLNGDCVVNQEIRTGAEAITVDSQPLVDCWQAKMVATTFVADSYSYNLPAAVGKYYAGLKCDTADATLGVNDQLGVFQALEAASVSPLMYGGPIVLSFKAYTTNPLTYCVNIHICDGTGTSRVIVKEFDIASSYIEQDIEITVNVPSGYLNGDPDDIGIKVVLGAITGSNNHITPDVWFNGNENHVYSTSSCHNYMGVVGQFVRFTQMKLEHGEIASSFVSEDYAVSLLRCNRYIWSGSAPGDGSAYHYGAAGNTGMIATNVTFPVEMVKSPACSTGGIIPPSETNCTSTSIGRSKSGLQRLVTVTATGKYSVQGEIFIADAYLL